MRINALLREPLLHFLLLGAALFVWFGWSGGGGGPGSNRIVFGPGQINQLVASYAKVWQRAPTETELKGLIDDWVREEIAVREAMTLGLDRDDAVIRRRLRQKLEFMTEGAAEAAPPTDQELNAWLAAHADAFRVEPQVAFRQVFFNRERRGASAQADARQALARLQAAGAAAPIDTLGDATMLPREVALAARREVARVFGAGFAERVEALAPGAWAGPVESGFGLHLVLVRERVAGRPAELSEVRAAVERELLAERRQRQLAAMYERLLARYSVVIERRPAEAGAVPAKGGS